MNSFLTIEAVSNEKIPIRSWDVLYPDEGALEFGDLETATSPETETVGGLNYSLSPLLSVWAGVRTANPSTSLTFHLAPIQGESFLVVGSQG
jgi:hypothetical protein